MKLNHEAIEWTGPTQNEDGSPFTEDQYGGFEIEIDGAPAVAVPNAWAEDRKYSIPMIDVIPELGVHTIRMRTVAKGGEVSEWTPELKFELKEVRPKPLPPANLAVR